jgi:hypothetical protein
MKKKYRMAIPLIGILMVVLAAFAYAAPCDTSYPVCPWNLSVGMQCPGTGGFIEEVQGPISFRLYACTALVDGCGDGPCNMLVHYDSEAYLLRCTGGPLSYCISQLGTPAPMNRRCTDGEPCGPGDPVDFPTVIYPPCNFTPCYWLDLPGLPGDSK